MFHIFLVSETYPQPYLPSETILADPSYFQHDSTPSMSPLTQFCTVDVTSDMILHCLCYLWHCSTLSISLQVYSILSNVLSNSLLYTATVSVISISILSLPFPTSNRHLHPVDSVRMWTYHLTVPFLQPVMDNQMETDQVGDAGWWKER
jgi:hypothetical protein